MFGGAVSPHAFFRTTRLEPSIDNAISRRQVSNLKRQRLPDVTQRHTPTIFGIRLKVCMARGEVYVEA
jgi:hypothetical protein